MLLGVFLMSVGVYGFVGADEQGAFVALVAGAYKMPVDARDWAAHWRVAMIQMVCSGAAMCVAAYGLWRLRANALLLLAGLMLAIVVVQLVEDATGYERYAFEVDEPGKIPFCLAVSATLVLLYVWARRTSPAVAGEV